MKDKNLTHISVFLAGQGVSVIGDFMLLVAVNIWVIDLTHSPAAVSVVWIIPAIAQLVVSPWAGSITDRLNRRVVLIVSDCIRAGVIAGMSLAANLWMLYLLLFMVNSVGAFFSASSSPYVTYLVPDHRRKRVNAIRGTLQSGAIVLGPAITGIIIHLTGHISFVFWIDAITFLVSAVSLFILPGYKSTVAVAAQAEQKSSVFRMWALDLHQAMRILRQRSFFTLIMSLVTLAYVIGAAIDSQEVVFAKQVLHLFPGQYSLLVSITGFGYVLGAIFVAVFANKLSLNLLIGMGLFLGSGGFVVYAFSLSFIVAAVGFVVLGIFMSLSSAGYSTFYQLSLPPELMGRVGNVITPTTQGLTIVLTVAAGLIAGAVGVRTTTIGFTVCMLMVGGATCMSILFRRANPMAGGHSKSA